MELYPDKTSMNSLSEGCNQCPEPAAARECISWGVGSLDADLVVVGEAPGAGNPDADRWKGGNWTGMAYTSRMSGRKIRKMFADLEYGPENLYFTNAVKCFPPDGEGGNREPTAAELANCRPYLLQEIEQVEPQCIVATGKHATRSLFAVEGWELDGFLDVVLDPVRCEHLGAPVLPVLHPSYQEVWISRLGHTRESYLEAIDEGIAASRDRSP